MASKDRENTIRGSLDSVEREFVEHFQSVGVDEREARRRARKMVKERGIGQRVERQARHDPEKARANREKQEAAARAARDKAEAAERRRHEEEKQKTGRKIFT